MRPEPLLHLREGVCHGFGATHFKRDARDYAHRQDPDPEEAFALVIGVNLIRPDDQ